MASTVETLARKSPALYDAQAEAEGSDWGKALARYRMKGMSEAEIAKYRTAWQQKQSKPAVNTVDSKSRKK